ncbi:nucleoside triphosphate pyrophosphohydrolase [Saccharomonospora sp. CUA-673]|uniref:MazG family protein n=1 Tax=Saccharomonospora sp. CUA-673 TaxID=1904969 RepID=UPI000967DA90|nr:MazG family protein [Saccharomonospora sp. CUA-673]OLT49237.1 nucleoside triphosphate pyrophosphohydrolase [Saccharomonospora sp. CUA-673]
MTWRSATVVLCSPALPDSLPAAALGVVRAAENVYAAPGLPDSLRVALDAKPAPHPDELTRQSGVVLVASGAHEPGAAALIAAGATVIEASVPPLSRAVEVMDRLRSPGGCPWDGAQTHESLRRYLIEETYELLEALEQQDRPAMREELGDVLLQVLFHARVAAEHDGDPFDVDDVARNLVDKMVGRHPHLFAGAEQVDSPEHQALRWEDLKQREKQRESLVDGVALGQPAAALAGKLGQRTGRAGVPFDLLPAEEGEGARLFRIAAAASRTGVDPEGALRAVAKDFAEQLRAAEAAAREAGRDPAELDADGWREFWPTPHP